MWPALSRIRAGSGSGMLGWGLVLTEEKTGLCRFPSNHGRRQAVSQAKAVQGKIKMATRTDAEGKQARLPAGHGGRHAEGPCQLVPKLSSTAKYLGLGGGGSDKIGLTVRKPRNMTTSQGQACTPDCLPSSFGHKQGH